MTEATATPGTEPIRVLVVDDQELFRRGLTMLLRQDTDIEVVGEAADGVDRHRAGAAARRPTSCSSTYACRAAPASRPAARSRRPCRRPRSSCSPSPTRRPTSTRRVKNGASGYLLKDSSIEEVAQAIRVVNEGQSLISPSMAVKLIDEFKQMSKPDKRAGHRLRLTDRELEVLRLVAKGLNNREVAKELFISENTVKNHVRNILEKLQLHSRMEAVMYAMKEKLLDLP